MIHTFLQMFKLFHDVVTKELGILLMKPGLHSGLEIIRRKVFSRNVFLELWEEMKI